LAWTLDGIAGRYEKAQKYDEARNIYKKIVTDYNDTDYALTAQKKLAVLEIKAGDDPKAQAALDSLIADFNDQPDLPEAVFIIAEQYYNKAFFYKKEGLDTEMKDCFQKTLAICERIITELPPNALYPAQAYLLSGECYRKLAQLQTAIEYYQKVVDDWPDYEKRWYAVFLIGNTYHKLGDSGDVEKSVANDHTQAAYEQVLKEYPDCQAAAAAQNWLKYNVKLSEGEQK
jgi:tetratricopeptide (TPR) repeat protein